MALSPYQGRLFLIGAPAGPVRAALARIIGVSGAMAK
jgi:hypothetical protein